MKTNVMTAAAFLEALRASNGRLAESRPAIVVQGDVLIKPEHLGEGHALSIEGVTFSSYFGVYKLRKGPGCRIFLRDCNFLGSFVLEDCAGPSLSLAGCRLRAGSLWQLSYESVHLGSVGASSLDVSGISASKVLVLQGLECDTLELAHASTHGTLQAARAVTDNPLFARQLHLAGIPVFVSTPVAAMVDAGPVARAGARDRR